MFPSSHSLSFSHTPCPYFLADPVLGLSKEIMRQDNKEDVLDDLGVKYKMRKVMVATL